MQTESNSDYVAGEWWETLPEMAKYSLWERAKDVNGVTLILRRTRSVPKSGKDSYRTELFCYGKVLPLAQMANEANGDWLLDKWAKTLEPIFWEYATKSAMKPAKIDSPESFVAAILTSDKYLADHPKKA